MEKRADKLGTVQLNVSRSDMGESYANSGTKSSKSVCTYNVTIRINTRA